MFISNHVSTKENDRFLMTSKILEVTSLHRRRYDVIEKTEFQEKIHLKLQR